MKKLTAAIIAALMILVFSLPAAAGPFSDIPADHWSYEAVNRLAASGILDGYPDGTFRGDDNLTRYEAAVIVNRVMENMDLTVEELQAEIEELGLSAEEAISRAVQALEKSEEAMRTAEEARDREPEMVVPEGLTEKQTEDIQELIAGLAYEFEDELENLDQLRRAFRALETRFNLAVSEILKVPELEEDVDWLKETNNIIISGKYGFDFSDIQIKDAGEESLPLESDYYILDNGDYVPGPDTKDYVYSDPYDDGSSKLEPGTTFEQTLEIDADIDVARDVDFRLGLSGIKHDFGTSQSAGLELDSMEFNLDTPHINIDAGTKRSVDFAPYAFSDMEMDGINLNLKNAGVDVFVGRDQIAEKVGEEPAVDSEGNDKYKYDEDEGYQQIMSDVKEDVDTIYFGAQTGTSLAGIDIGGRFVGTAAEEELERKLERRLIGFDAAANYGGLDLEMDYANALDVEVDSSLIRLLAATEVGPAAVAFTYRNIKPGFAPLKEDEDVFDGDIYTDGLNPGIRGMSLETEGEIYGIDTGLLLSSVNPEQDVDRDDARLLRLTGSRDDLYIQGLTLGGLYEYEYNTDNDVDRTSTRGLDLEFSGVENALVSLGYRLKNPLNDDNTFVPERKLELGMDYSLTDNFLFNYEYKRIDGLKMNEDAEKRTNIYGVNMLDYPAFDSLLVSAGYELERISGIDEDSESLDERTQTLSAGAAYDLEPLLLSAGYSRKMKDGDGVSDRFNNSAYSETDLGIKYNIAEDTALSVGYRLGNFQADDTAHSYAVQEATAGLSLEF